MTNVSNEGSLLAAQVKAEKAESLVEQNETDKPRAPAKQSRGPSKAEKAQEKIDARAEVIAELRAELVPGGHCPICAKKVYGPDPEAQARRNELVNR